MSPRLIPSLAVLLAALATTLLQSTPAAGATLPARDRLERSGRGGAQRLEAFDTCAHDHADWEWAVAPTPAHPSGRLTGDGIGTSDTVPAALPSTRGVHPDAYCTIRRSSAPAAGVCSHDDRAVRGRAPPSV